MQSTNGTWVTERKIALGEKCALNTGDNIAFSRSCVFIVK